MTSFTCPTFRCQSFHASLITKRLTKFNRTFTIEIASCVLEISKRNAARLRICGIHPDVSNQSSWKRIKCVSDLFVEHPMICGKHACLLNSLVKVTIQIFNAYRNLDHFLASWSRSYNSNLDEMSMRENNLLSPLYSQLFLKSHSGVWHRSPQLRYHQKIHLKGFSSFARLLKYNE